MTRDEVTKEKNLIIAQIEKYVPLMRRFFENDLSLQDYSRKLYDFDVAPVHKDRQELIRNKILAKFSKLFGIDAKDKLKINFGEKLAFNIADHHQVLSHPFLISANIISSAQKFFQKEKQDAIIVVSSGDVPPNNYFSRNGLVFQGKRVPIFSVSEREYTSYYVAKRKFNLVERLKLADRWKDFDTDEKSFIQEHERMIESFDYSSCANYIDQITVIVKNTWPLLFERQLRGSLPELLYITQEELTTECLIDLLKDDDNFITQTLFNQKFREKVLENFRGIVVAWRESEGKGTHFFWRKYPGEPRSLRMFIKGQKLVPHDGRFENLAVPLDRDEIIKLLQEREIYPSLFLIFSLLNFYAGVRPLTGFGSAVYLEFFKQAWIRSLPDSEFSGEIPLIEGVGTSGLVAGIVLFFKRIEGKLKTLYAHDIFLEGGVKGEYLEKILGMPFDKLFSVGVADMYDYFSSKYIPPEEKIKKTVNFDDLAGAAFDWI